MERIRELNRYQKTVLIVMALMMVVFAVAYPVINARLGYEYADQILVPSQENGATIYSGTIRGEDAVFTVTDDKTVTFQWGDKTYGPYTAKEDPTAVPEDDDLAGYMTGVEIRCGQEVIFRGGVTRFDGGLLLVDEEGNFSSLSITVTTSNGVERDMYGNVVDPMEPGVGTILELMDDPALTRKGAWAMFLLGTFVCVVTAVTILFADDLFYIHMSFRVQDPQYAEPSDFEIAGRYISWTVLPVMALVIYIIGLTI